MKALVLSGAREGETAVDDAAEGVSGELRAAGWEVDCLRLRDMEIARCQGCFACWTRTPGICVIDDAGRQVAELAVQSDLMVWVSPVTFGGYSSELKKALDRLIPVVSPFFMKIGGEVHHKPRYDHYPAIATVGVLSRLDEESEDIFRTLLERNTINLHSPACGAEVLSMDQTPETVEQQIGSLLRKVGAKE